MKKEQIEKKRENIFFAKEKKIKKKILKSRMKGKVKRKRN